jgi:hypothetical protein
VCALFEDSRTQRRPPSPRRMRPSGSGRRCTVRGHERIAGILNSADVHVARRPRGRSDPCRESASAHCVALPASVAAARGRAWARSRPRHGTGTGRASPRHSLDIPGTAFDATKTKLLVDHRGDRGRGRASLRRRRRDVVHTTGALGRTVAGHYAAHVMIDGADPRACRRPMPPSPGGARRGSAMWPPS